jgi:hypothetical protein
VAALLVLCAASGFLWVGRADAVAKPPPLPLRFYESKNVHDRKSLGRLVWALRRAPGIVTARGRLRPNRAALVGVRTEASAATRVVALASEAGFSLAPAPDVRDWPALPNDRGPSPYSPEWTNRDLTEIGEPAPDFRLLARDGKSSVRLSDYRGNRPVVLVFGSYT